VGSAGRVILLEALALELAFTGAQLAHTAS
jgi:hypothetical protein